MSSSKTDRFSSRRRGRAAKAEATGAPNSKTTAPTAKQLIKAAGRAAFHALLKEEKEEKEAQSLQRGQGQQHQQDLPSFLTILTPSSYLTVTNCV